MTIFVKKTSMRILGLALVLMMVFGLSSVAFAEADPYFALGSGTEEDPFLLSTPDDLFMLSDIMTSWDAELQSQAYAWYKLTNDIDMAGYDWYPIGESNARIFRGNFNGNNMTISNLASAPQNGLDAFNRGFFGYLGGTVYDLKLTNVNFSGNPAGSASGMGGITGTLWTNLANGAIGVVENCSVTGTLTTETGNNVGGIVGLVSGPNARISNCSFIGYITAETSSSNYLGGIVGRINADNLIVEDCYSGGILTRPGIGGQKIGKIAGGAAGTQMNTSTFTNDTTTMFKIATSLIAGDVWEGYDGIEVFDHDHALIGAITKEATCVSTGEMTYACDACDEARIGVIARNLFNHDGDTTETVIFVATEDAEGSIGVYCADCNALIDTRAIPKVGTKVDAFVTKRNGNNNDLTITIAENFADGKSIEIDETFAIKNNASDYYEIGEFLVYVGTTGNDKISGIKLYKLINIAA